MQCEGNTEKVYIVHSKILLKTDYNHFINWMFILIKAVSFS